MAQENAPRENQRPTEAKVETKVQDGQTIKTPDIFGNPVGGGAVPETVTPQQGNQQQGNQRQGNQQQGNRLPGGQRNAEETRARAAQAQLPDNMFAADFIANLFANGAEDEISNKEARRRAGITNANRPVYREQVERREDRRLPTPGERRPEPVTTRNLPAVINRALQQDNLRVVPQWSEVRHLPGYMVNQIRRLGRDVFRNFTNVPIEDIQIVTTILSPETEVRGLMGWIQRNGVRDESVRMTFGNNVPNAPAGFGMERIGGRRAGRAVANRARDIPNQGGIEADVSLWHTENYSFLLVRDFAGCYVYGWAGGRGVHLENDAQQQIAVTPAENNQDETPEDEPPTMRM